MSAAIPPTHPEPTPRGSAEWDTWAAEDKGPQILIACWTVIGFASLFVVARLYVRGVLQKKLWLDDYLIAAAIVCSYLSTALSTLSVAHGDGKHFSTLTVLQQEASILWTTAGFCPGVMSFGLPKLAVVVLLRRLLLPGRIHGAFLWFLGIFTQLVLLATVGVLIGRCYPARAQWDFSITEKKCFSTRILASYCIFAGSWSAFVDFYLAFYPAAVLFKLRMSLKKKLGLSFALGIGSISGAVAVYKTSRLYLLQSPDFSYDTSDLVIWTVVEGSTIIIASSIPLLQPLLEPLLDSRFFSSKSSKGRQYYEDYSDAKPDSNPIVTIGSKPTRMKLTPYDDVEMTVMRDPKDSQEEILGSAEGQGGAPVSGRSHSPGARDANGILRTDEVRITYGDVKR
ncbi:integral membrane protein [Xylariomycetidae sp. FL2044]|nr:integral membrane protein [Xylariomycetidae sp. FL2044]